MTLYIYWLKDSERLFITVGETIMNCCICKKEFIESEKKVNFIPNNDESKICENCYNRISYLKQYGGDAQNNISERSYEFLHNKRDEINNPEVLNRLDEILGLYSDEETYNRMKQEKVEQQQRDRSEFQRELEKQHKQMFNGAGAVYYDVLMSTTHFLEGYEIDEYVDIVNSEYIIGTGIFSEWGASFSDLFGTQATGYQGKLSKAKQMALYILKAKAHQLKCNAVLGIDIDISTIGNNMIMVSSNGTAVRAKKITKTE